MSLGLGVVKEELAAMTRCKALAIAHFIFGGIDTNLPIAILSTNEPHFMIVMYAVAVVEIELETVSIATLFFFVLPLAFTLSTFLLWIMYGLQGKILFKAVFLRYSSFYRNNG